MSDQLPAHQNHCLALDQAISHCASVFTSTRQQRVGELERSVKSVAKTMAQSVAVDIEDRKQRSRARTGYYNQLVPLLRAVTADRLVERVRFRKILIVAGANSVLLALAVAGLLVLSL